MHRYYTDTAAATVLAVSEAKDSTTRLPQCKACFCLQAPTPDMSWCKWEPWFDIWWLHAMPSGDASFVLFFNLLAQYSLLIALFGCSWPPSFFFLTKCWQVCQVWGATELWNPIKVQGMRFLKEPLRLRKLKGAAWVRWLAETFFLESSSCQKNHFAHLTAQIQAFEWSNESAWSFLMIWKRKCWAWRILSPLARSRFEASWRRMASCVRLVLIRTQRHSFFKSVASTIPAMQTVTTAGDNGRIAWTFTHKPPFEQEMSFAFRTLTCVSLAKWGSNSSRKIGVFVADVRYVASETFQIVTGESCA